MLYLHHILAAIAGFLRKLVETLSQFYLYGMMFSWQNYIILDINTSEGMCTFDSAFNLLSQNLACTSCRDGNYRLSDCPGQVKFVSDM